MVIGRIVFPMFFTMRFVVGPIHVYTEKRLLDSENDPPAVMLHDLRAPEMLHRRLHTVAYRE